MSHVMMRGKCGLVAATHAPPVYTAQSALEPITKPESKVLGTLRVTYETCVRFSTLINVFMPLKC